MRSYNPQSHVACSACVTPRPRPTIKRTAAAQQTARAKWAMPRDTGLQGHAAQQHEEEQQHGEQQENSTGAYPEAKGTPSTRRSGSAAKKLG